MSDNKPRLKHCPFCDSDPMEGVYSIVKVGERYYFRCYCGKCGMTGPIAKTETGADRLWNRRPRRKA